MSRLLATEWHPELPRNLHSPSPVSHIYQCKVCASAECMLAASAEAPPSASPAPSSGESAACPLAWTSPVRPATSRILRYVMEFSGTWEARVPSTLQLLFQSTRESGHEQNEEKEKKGRSSVFLGFHGFPIHALQWPKGCTGATGPLGGTGPAAL